MHTRCPWSSGHSNGRSGRCLRRVKEQLSHSPEGCHETALPWRGNHRPLPNNYEGSIHRLNTLVCKLRRTDMLSEYDVVISEQLEQGVVEKVPEKVEGKEFSRTCNRRSQNDQTSNGV